MIAADEMPYFARARAFVGSSLAVLISFYRSVFNVPMLFVDPLFPAADGLIPSFLEELGTTLPPF